MVVVLVDTLRSDHLPFYGYTKATAPFLAGLSKQSVVFERAYSTSSWTAPATASLFTSLYPFQHRVITGLRASRLGGVPVNRIPQEVVTLAERFQQAGYRTYGISDNLSVSSELGFGAGFDRFEAHNYRGAEAVRATLLRWAREAFGKAERPYFLYIHFMDPHVPLHERAPYYEAMLGREAKPAGKASSSGPPKRPAAPGNALRKVVDSRHGVTWVVDKLRSRPATVAAYDSEIRYLDDHIRSLYHALGWRENTLFVFTADHGEEYGDHGTIGHGHSLYREVVQVPLMFYYPQAFGEGRRVSTPVSLVDVLPTLADVLEQPADSMYEGVSLLPWLRNPVHAATGEPRELFAHLQIGNPREPAARKGALPSYYEAEKGRTQYSLMRGEYKYIVSNAAPPLLFNVEHDPLEKDELQGVEPEVAARMRAAMDAYVEHARRFKAEHQTVQLKKEESERLRALGYAQ